MKEIKKAGQGNRARNSIIEILKFGSSGWYGFKNVPQEMNYIKVYNVRCGTDIKATNQATRINPNHEYIIRKVKA